MYYFHPETNNFLPIDLFPAISEKGEYEGVILLGPYTQEKFEYYMEKRSKGYTLIPEGDKIVLNEPEETSFQKEKELAISTLRKLVSSKIKKLPRLYSESEESTFSLQLEEATSYSKDSESETPLLSGIAEARGITVKSLVKKILSKSSKTVDSRKSVGFLIGRGRELEKKINSTRSRKSLTRLMEDLEDAITP